MMSRDSLPLQGVKVLDLGTVLMAPYAAQWLADLGADVIKVEAPRGDKTRQTGPAVEDDMSSMFLSLNRNKRSIVLDLKTAAGHAALLRLVEQSDVLIHNNRPHKMAALGLDAAALRERNPRLVYACLHGFGENGPYGGRPAYDDVIQGMCGLADLMRQHIGTARYVPSAVADKACGLVGALAVLSALLRRDRTGVGNSIEVPMFETMVSFTAAEHFYGMHFDPPQAEAVYPRIAAPERRPFATSDGFICALPYTDKHWRDLFDRCGRADLAADARFDGMFNRTTNIAPLYRELQAILATRTTSEWLALLEALDIPCAPVTALGDLINDQHLKAVGYFEEIDAGDGQRLRFPGVPVLFNGERPTIGMPPRLGEHTREILCEAGLDEKAIDELMPPAD
jgi:crotonobetainyl-CoA:carnitine CoA-transferase CaiB-like acyl-CoA transferase